MNFSEEIDKIEGLRKEHNLSAIEVFTLQILKSIEYSQLDYNQILESFINNHTNNDIKEDTPPSKDKQ